jgi:hypothetical protein
MELAGPSPDVERPSPARMYDYFLGGSHNFAVDRRAAEAARRAYPRIAAGMRANRSFLRRVVRHLVASGIDQFLDLGSGIPTVGNVHEIAQRANPDARVVYVDNEAIAVAHSRSILEGNDRAIAIQADLRDPEAVLGNPQVRDLLDFTRPVAVLLVAVLHFVPDSDDPAGIVAAYRDAIPQGSYVAISHGSTEGLPVAASSGVGGVTAVYDRSTNPITLRSREEIAALFAGLDVVEPGVVHVLRWRPDRDDEEFDEWISGFVGLGRKP